MLEDINLPADFVNALRYSPFSPLLFQVTLTFACGFYTEHPGYTESDYIYQIVGVFDDVIPNVTRDILDLSVLSI